MDNKFPGKDISYEDLKTKFPLAAKKNKNHKSVFKIAGVEFGGKNIPIFAGPNMVESKNLIFDIAKNIKKNNCHFLRGGAFKPLTFPYRSKSYNETREKGIEWLAEAKMKYKIPIITEVMEEKFIPLVSEVADILQIGSRNMQNYPLISAAAKTNKIVNVKKGQFLAPGDMINVTKKISDTGNKNILVTERGASFGYNTLVSDMRSLPIMAKNGYPVIFDATHSVQQPGGLGEKSGGQREFVEHLARAAVAVGVAGVFIETHQDPDNAPSDGPNMVPLDKLENLLKQLTEIDNLIKN